MKEKEIKKVLKEFDKLCDCERAKIAYITGYEYGNIKDLLDGMEWARNQLDEYEGDEYEINVSLIDSDLLILYHVLKSKKLKSNRKDIPIICDKLNSLSDELRKLG